MLTILCHADRSNAILKKVLKEVSPTGTVPHTCGTQVLQAQHSELQEMMEVARGRGAASHLHNYPQTLAFIGALCVLAFDRFPDDAAISADVAAIST